MERKAEERKVWWLLLLLLLLLLSVAYPGILFGRRGRGGSTNSVEDRENGDLWAVAP